MNDTVDFGFPEAARQLGVSIRVLRRAIRAGKIPAPAQNTATARLSGAWLASVEEAVLAAPHLLSASLKQKTPPFARYPGTSAWTKYASRVRGYARFRASLAV